MSIEADINTDANGNIIMHIRGGLNYENSTPFRQELIEMARTNPTCSITLDLFKLDFVGSSGIGYFVESCLG